MEHTGLKVIILYFLWGDMYIEINLFSYSYFDHLHNIIRFNRIVSLPTNVVLTVAVRLRTYISRQL